MVMGKRKIFIAGCMWEDEAWIEFDKMVSELGGGKPCQHCYDSEQRKHTRHDGSTWIETIWCCPRIIVATNEGGCNSTGVCLDCVIEAAKDLEGMNDDKKESGGRLP
jgi:hypothetical protein